MSCNVRELSACLIQGDSRTFSWVFVGKSTKLPIPLTGSTFDFTLRLASGGANIISWASGIDTAKFDLTELPEGRVSLLFAPADTIGLDPTRTYVAQMRQIKSDGSVFTLTFFTFKVKPKL